MQRLKDTWPPQYTLQAKPQETRGLVGEKSSFNFFAHSHRFSFPSQCYVVAQSCSLKDRTRHKYTLTCRVPNNGETIPSDAILENFNFWLLAHFLLSASVTSRFSQWRHRLASFLCISKRVLAASSLEDTRGATRPTVVDIRTTLHRPRSKPSYRMPFPLDLQRNLVNGVLWLRFPHFSVNVGQRFSKE